MDIKELTSLIIEKLHDYGLYSELDEKQLFSSVYGYLDNIYRKYLAIAKRKIAEDEQKGIFPSQAEYKKQHDNVESIVIIYANKIAATEKSEI